LVQNTGQVTACAKPQQPDSETPSAIYVIPRISIHEGDNQSFVVKDVVKGGIIVGQCGGVKVSQWS
jgi:hypothetical protein